MVRGFLRLRSCSERSDGGGHACGAHRHAVCVVAPWSGPLRGTGSLVCPVTVLVQGRRESRTGAVTRAAGKDPRRARSRRVGAGGLRRTGDVDHERTDLADRDRRGGRRLRRTGVRRALAIADALEHDVDALQVRCGDQRRLTAELIRGGAGAPSRGSPHGCGRSRRVSRTRGRGGSSPWPR